jgi:Holliday junction resolvase
MNGRGRRNKGKQGEREFAKLLGEGLGIEFSRNLDQVRNGGYDLIGLKQLAIEVKRCETLCIGSWWKQAKSQAKEDQTPVLAYRQSRKDWTVIVPAKFVTKDLLALCQYDEKRKIMLMTLDTFIKLIAKKLRSKVWNTP